MQNVDGVEELREEFERTWRNACEGRMKRCGYSQEKLLVNIFSRYQ